MEWWCTAPHHTKKHKNRGTFAIFCFFIFYYGVGPCGVLIIITPSEIFWEKIVSFYSASVIPQGAPSKKFHFFKLSAFVQRRADYCVCVCVSVTKMYGPEKSSYFKCGVRFEYVAESKLTGAFSRDEVQSNQQVLIDTIYIPFHESWQGSH